VSNCAGYGYSLVVCLTVLAMDTAGELCLTVQDMGTDG
jgi:hypothetical protein